jgi:hypothetical protein
MTTPTVTSLNHWPWSTGCGNGTWTLGWLLGQAGWRGGGETQLSGLPLIHCPTDMGYLGRGTTWSQRHWTSNFAATKFMNKVSLQKLLVHHKNQKDIHLWKHSEAVQQEILEFKTEQWVCLLMCQMAKDCKCTAHVRLCTGKKCKLLEFYWVHDEHSHDNGIVHVTVIVALNQFATKFQCNILQNLRQGKHNGQAHLQCIQWRVIATWKVLMIQQMSAFGPALVLIQNCWTSLSCSSGRVAPAPIPAAPPVFAAAGSSISNGGCCAAQAHRNVQRLGPTDGLTVG